MELTKNQKIIGISLAGVIAWLLYRKHVKLQSQRVETPAGPAQVVVPVTTSAGTGAIANVLGNVIPTAHTELVAKALSAVPLVVQNNRVAPTRISTIADMQHALNFLKICSVPLKDSGVLDAPTVACIKAFQSIMQIPITGLDDPTTKSALESAVTKSAISTTATTVLSHPTVVSPPHVNPIIQTERDLQRALNILGASPKLKEDGKIGPVTTAAIKAFQVAHGLVADGLAGPKTKAAIAAASQGGGTAVSATPHPTAPVASVMDVATQAMAASGDFGYVAPPHEYGIPAPPHFQPAPPHHHPAPPVTHPAIPGFYDPQAGQWFSGEFGAPRGAMAFHPGVRPHHPMGIRGRAWLTGVPYDEDVVEVVEIEDEDGTPVYINGEQLEAGAMWEARHAYEEAHRRGDRRFEHPSVEPGAPPMPWENREREERHRFERHEYPWREHPWHERFLSWFGFGPRRLRVDENPYIPPAATPQVVDWDPFKVSTVTDETYYTLDTVPRWHPEELRRKEELERRGYAPHSPADHPVPPPPATRPGAPITTPAAPHPTAPHPAAPIAHPAAPAAPHPAAPLGPSLT